MYIKTNVTCHIQGNGSFVAGQVLINENNETYIKMPQGAADLFRQLLLEGKVQSLVISTRHISQVARAA